MAGVVSSVLAEDGVVHCLTLPGATMALSGAPWCATDMHLRIPSPGECRAPAVLPPDARESLGASPLLGRLPVAFFLVLCGQNALGYERADNV